MLKLNIAENNFMPDDRPFDEIYKTLFSDKRMVTDFLQGFIHDDWVDDLDFSTLTNFSAEHITLKDTLIFQPTLRQIPAC